MMTSFSFARVGYVKSSERVYCPFAVTSSAGFVLENCSSDDEVGVLQAVSSSDIDNGESFFSMSFFGVSTWDH